MAYQTYLTCYTFISPYIHDIPKLLWVINLTRAYSPISPVIDSHKNWSSIYIRHLDHHYPLFDHLDFTVFHTICRALQLNNSTGFKTLDTISKFDHHTVRAFLQLNHLLTHHLFEPSIHITAPWRTLLIQESTVT